MSWGSAPSGTPFVEWMNSCCNHITYAYVACQMQLHKHIVHNSTTLQDAMRDFAKTARRATGDPANLWPKLSDCDAPRALSDALLALVAAVCRDGGWSTMVRIFKPIFEKHVLDHFFIPEMIRRDGGPAPAADPVSHLHRLAAKENLAVGIQQLPEPESTAVAGPRVHDAVTSAMRLNTSNSLDPGRGRSFEPMALAPAPPTAVNATLSDADQRRHDRLKQHQGAFTLRDFNPCSLWLGGVLVGPVVGSSSPRSAQRRLASLVLGGNDDGETSRALRAAALALDDAQSSDEAHEKVRRVLLERGALEEDSLVRENAGGGASKPPLVVRCPAARSENMDAHLDVSSSNSEDVEEDMDRLKASSDTASQNEGAVYCPACEMWLNGPTQGKDHTISKKHKKNLKRARKPTNIPPCTVDHHAGPTIAHW